MELWLDTNDLSIVQKAQQMGVLHGVTTNPTIVACSGKPLEELLQALLKIQNGPVTAQVTASTGAEMIKQGEALAKLSPRIYVKIPVTREGLKAIYALSQKKIPVMATAIFDPNQAMLAARAGANYLVPYFSHIYEADQDGINEIRTMMQMVERYHYSSKIIAAFLKSTEHVRDCYGLGLHAVTLNEKLFDEYLEDHPKTIKTIKGFDRDWKTASASKILPF